MNPRAVRVAFSRVRNYLTYMETRDAGRPLRLVRGGDWALLVILLLLSGAVTAVSAVWLTEQGARAVVLVDGRVEAVLQLEDVGRRVTVSGPLGDTIIEVTEAGVRIVDSACPRHTCVKMGVVRRTGRMVICVPNRVVVRIEGPKADRIDGVTG